MSIQRFEDIQAWQEARALTGRIYAATREGEFARDFGLRDQIRRATVSIMANIAEGFDRRSNKEFRQFLGIAFASASEVKSHLYVALDQGYIRPEEFDAAYEQCAKTARLIYGFINYLSKHPVQPRSPNLEL